MGSGDGRPDTLGSTEPSAERVMLAHRLRTMHSRICVPEPACRWCLRNWPCPDEQWSAKVLDRAANERNWYGGGHDV